MSNYDNTLSLKPKQNQKTFNYNLQKARENGVSDEDSFNYLKENTNIDFSSFENLDNKSAILESITKNPITLKEKPQLSREEAEFNAIKAQAYEAKKRLDDRWGITKALSRKGINNDILSLEITSEQKQDYADRNAINLYNALTNFKDSNFKDYQNKEESDDLLYWYKNIKDKPYDNYKNDERAMKILNNTRGTLNRIHDALNPLNTEDKEAHEYNQALKGKMIISQEARDEIQTIRSASHNNAFDNADNTKNYLLDLNRVAKKHGFEKASIDTENKGEIYFVKDGVYYSTASEHFFDNWSNAVKDNPISTATTFIPVTGALKTIGTAAFKGAKALGASKNMAKMAAYTANAGAMGAMTAAGSAADYAVKQAKSDRELKADEMLTHTLHGAVGGAGFYLGGVALEKSLKGIKGVYSNTKGKYNDFKEQGGSITESLKETILNAENRAINHKLDSIAKKDVDNAYKNFIDTQSDTIIAKEIKEDNIISKAIDKINTLNPINYLSKGSKKSQEKLLANVFSNPNLAKEFAGSIDAAQAEILNKFVTKMGNEFKNANAELEKEIINNYVTKNQTHLDSIPQIYNDLLKSIDKEAQTQYGESIKSLENVLTDTNFKDTLLQSYINITDKAAEDLGLDNPLFKEIYRRTKNIDERPNITLSQAIEERKELNDLLRSYNKKDSTLVKFRANDRLDSLKNEIDKSIQSALDSKVANNEITQEARDAAWKSFTDANKEYAEVKTLLNDKFAKEILKPFDKKYLNSKLTEEQWKQKVLDTSWGESIHGLENSIFKKFNPKMQENTQLLVIFRALDKNISGVKDNVKIDFETILKDIESLENLTILHPRAAKALDLFKKYANAYRFAQDISEAAKLKTGTNSGIATTLEGRLKGWWAGQVFKKVFALLPTAISRNIALTQALESGIKNLKYPREITLKTLDILIEEDKKRLAKGAKIKSEGFTDKPLNTPEREKQLAKDITESKNDNKTTLNENEATEIYEAMQNPQLAKLENEAKRADKIKDMEEIANDITEGTLKHIIQNQSVASKSIDKDFISNLISTKPPHDIEITADFVKYQYKADNNDLYNKIGRASCRERV